MAASGESGLSGKGDSGISPPAAAGTATGILSVNDRLHHPEAGTSATVRVLHVSADFPDPVAPDKTRVIQNLLALTQDRFMHRVISLNRKSPDLAALLRGPSAAMPPAAVPFDWGEALTYEAPGRGLFHRSYLLRIADAIAERIEGQPRPDLIVGHKLTVEGIVVQRLSAITGVPFAITIQGNTDGKILAARPDLAPVFRSIFRQAASVTAFAPWALAQVAARLGERTGPTAIVPCPTELDTPMPPRPGGHGLLSLFHLRGHANKNLKGMADALRLLDARGTPQTLAICGGGSAQDAAAARHSAAAAPGLSFEGALSRDAVPTRMNAASAFVLPSFRESFGLVFIEALFAGLPIIYPQDRAVSGWFDDCPFAIPVPPRDTRAIADAMARAVREERALKEALAAWQVSSDAQRFGRTAIARAYAEALEAGLPCAADSERSERQS